MINLNFPEPSKVFNKQIYDNLQDYSKFIEVWYGGASSGSRTVSFKRSFLNHY